jgi:hypothetical protein
MAVTMMSKLLASGMAEGGRERADAAPPPLPLPVPTKDNLKGQRQVPGQPRHVAREKHSAICTGFRHGKTPCSSARLGSAQPSILLSSMHALTHRSKTAFPARSWLHAESLELPLATTDALTRHVAPRQVETVYNRPLHTDSYCRTPAISPCSGFFLSDALCQVEDSVHV